MYVIATIMSFPGFNCQGRWYHVTLLNSKVM
jgi:hypothetical protein